MPQRKRAIASGGQNDGTSLENRVLMIERALVPQGFTIEKRKRLFSDKGSQRAEFDIIIRGQIGSAQIECLIECRDRPSEGPAPAKWIQELIGRRLVFDFDKVMAASSTGFSDEAKDQARKEDIDIRTLDNLTYESVMGWLPANAPISGHKRVFDNIHLSLAKITSDELNTINTALEATDLQKTPIFSDTASGDMLNLGQFLERVCNKNPHLLDALAPGGDSNQSTTQFNCEDGQYQVRVGEYSASLAMVDFTVHLEVSIPRMPLTQFNNYSDADGKTIATIATWSGQEGGPIKEITVILYRK